MPARDKTSGSAEQLCSRLVHLNFFNQNNSSLVKLRDKPAESERARGAREYLSWVSPIVIAQATKNFSEGERGGVKTKEKE